MRPTYLVYRFFLPLYVLIALPAWLGKMARRGGFGSGLLERVGWFDEDRELEPCRAVHVHAVSVGETLMAVRLIRAWRLRRPDQAFVLAVGTATGKRVAYEAGMSGVRVVYQPLDFALFVRRYFRRFEPAQIVLVEGEMWPNLLAVAERVGVPVRLVNA
ncbi:MAG: 3-deoxy-D-manno-octulosonic acid transferase, partial [Verrucomicrobiales bacterium]